MLWTDMVYIGAAVVIHMMLTVMSLPVRTDRRFNTSDKTTTCTTVFRYKVEVCLYRIFQMHRRRVIVTYGTSSIYLDVHLHFYCRQYSATLQCLHDELSHCDTPYTTSVIQDRLSQPWALTSNQYCGIHVNEQMDKQAAKHVQNGATKSQLYNSIQTVIQPVKDSDMNKQNKKVTEMKQLVHWKNRNTAEHQTASVNTKITERTTDNKDIEDTTEVQLEHNNRDSLKYQPMSMSKIKDDKSELKLSQGLSNTYTHTITRGETVSEI